MPDRVIYLGPRARAGATPVLLENAQAPVMNLIARVLGVKTDERARYEAQCATRLLSGACDREVAVKAAIIFVDLDDFTVKQLPTDVHVTTRRRLLAWLHSLPVSIGEGEIEAIYATARLSSTWK